MQIRSFLLVLAGIGAGCADPAPEAGQTPVDSVAASRDTTPAHPDSAAIQRYRAMLPDSVLARANACPFECCVYGTWVAQSQIPVYHSARASGTPEFTAEPGDTMRADSGVVFITSIALVAVEDTVFRNAETQVWMVPGDTLVLLDPIGEGYWTAWRRGEILEEVPPFFESWSRESGSGRLIGKPAREWWVRATFNGRTGWFRPDQFRVSGADACS